MALLSLAKSIENIDSPAQAKVLAVINHLMPILANWRQGEDLRDAISGLEANIRDGKAELDTAKAELIARQNSLSAVKSLIFGTTPVVLIVSGVAAGAGLAFVAPAGMAATVGVVLLTTGLLLAKKAGIQLKNHWSEQVGLAESTVATHDSGVTQLLANRKGLAAQLAERVVGFPELKVADVRFGLQCTEIAGQSVLLDLSGAHEETVLKAVDVSNLQSGLSSISEKVKPLLFVPPLLTPDSRAEHDDPVHALFGEENLLQELVTDFTVNLGQLRDVTLRLPLVPKQSILVQRLNAGSLNQVLPKTAIDIHANASNAGDIQAFVNEVNQTKVKGQKAFQDLSDVFGDLEKACDIYAAARVSSVNTIHQNLVEVLNRAAWCNRRFYCPRTIQSPKYLEDLLGVDPDRAYLLSLDDLLGRLRGDSEVRKRLEAKLEVEDQLCVAYQAVQEFMGGVSFDQNGDSLEKGARPKHIEQQFQEAVRQFSNVLQRILTGTAYPILNFSKEAQLFFDPELEEWSSTASPYVYGTADALKYGSVVKAYSDLMLPMWEHLWTEKADFRKAELFRTNESMIRMSEKESEKLINIADQFRADMRTVRGNVYLIESELSSKSSEIISFRDGMDALGLLSARAKEQITDDKLGSIAFGDSALSSTDRFETLLSTMPQTQAESRGTVHDPIDMVKEPDALLGYQRNPSLRLLAQ